MDETKDNYDDDDDNNNIRIIYMMRQKEITKGGLRHFYVFG